jgi:hypothetical protein
MPIAALGLSGHCNGYRATVAMICNRNEAADKLADLGAMTELWDTARASEPTVSGVCSIVRNLQKAVQYS